MLYDLNSDKYIASIPHQREYDLWKSRLTDAELNAIFTELNNRIGENQVKTAGWIPGADWTGTEFEPIYSKACSAIKKTQQSALGFLCGK